MSLSDFWASTPREVVQVVRGYSKRYRQQHRLATIQAYWAGAIARSGGTLPKYDKMFPETDEDGNVKPPSGQEHLEFWENLAAGVNADVAAKEAAASGQDPQTV